ncbi:TIGR03032 family protein [Nocardioides sp.]|uniref:TIGR03032 family protein n=1 Tax=Nocardioides sp. TaxID=35761 RepID=UPI00261C7563|nr:TIGR03032 family protein [Nocardioides sp.]
MSPDRPHGLVRPVFVIAAPGAGGDLVAAVLAQASGATGLPRGRGLTESQPKLTPAERGYDSARLFASDARRVTITDLEHDLGVDPSNRLVGTWPAAALQVPFLAEAWPDASFVFVHRDPAESLALMRDAWTHGTAVSEPDLPGWTGPAWSFPLVPQWRDLDPSDLRQVITAQWCRIVDQATSDLARLPRTRWTSVSLHELIARPAEQLARLGNDLGLSWATPPALAPATPVTPLGPDDLGPHLATVAASAQHARETLENRSGAPTTEGLTGFESVATTNVAQLLTLLHSSLVATTYQSGRVVMMRALNGTFNTHFRQFDKPMGIAYRPGMLALGTRNEVWTMVDVPGLADRTEEENDAVFAPRTMLATGDIRIHDVGWIGDQIWAVNTRFSCLVTFDGLHSFVPRWKPSFISDLAAEDRCHLNGMAIVEDRVKYVTALGTTDTAGGWRPTKADGGVIIDVETDRIVASGLSMPHSPRWYQDTLWVLESGQGSLARVDVETGEVTTVATLPGFTRGLAFAGRYAFVGLSKVREATTFGGLPLTARLEDRECGIWIVDIETGQIMGFVRFEGQVEEIFDVALLPGIALPDIFEPTSEELETAFVLPS